MSDWLGKGLADVLRYCQLHYWPSHDIQAENHKMKMHQNWFCHPPPDHHPLGLHPRLHHLHPHLPQHLRPHLPPLPNLCNTVKADPESSVTKRTAQIFKLTHVQCRSVKADYRCAYGSYSALLRSSRHQQLAE